MMKKEEMTDVIIMAKTDKKTTWEALGKATKLDPICIAAACLGSASLLEDEADALVTALNLGEEVKAALMRYPTKGIGQVVPSDPLIYRFYEIAYVYGPSAKEVIHEMFGDGIMSAIDYTMKINRVEDPKGDRVQVVMEGKFLPYKKW